MTNVKITDLPVATGIDPINDTFPIVNGGLNVTDQINRNVFLGITGMPVGTTDSQSLTNKTIGITNTVTILDTLFTLENNADNTKKAQFQLSGITTGTTRTYTLPDASSTLADISTAQTLTNKTLTSPVISGGSIANTTITVDSINEFTASHGVTIAGLNIKSGALNTSNSVITASITDAAVTPAKLIAGTGASWVFQNWTPTITNVTIGNGTLNARYTQIGKLIVFRITIVAGSTTSVSGNVSFSLPVTATSYGTSTTPIGNIEIEDASVNNYEGMISLASTTTMTPLVLVVTGTYANWSAWNATVPYNTFGIGDSFSCSGYYEAA